MDGAGGEGTALETLTFNLSDPRILGLCRLPDTNRSSFLECCFWIVSGLPTIRQPERPAVRDRGLGKN